MTLDEAYKSSLGSENYYRYKRILYIGSESYDAPTITVLQGLNHLGFEIHTLKKPNINSWFCNRVIDPSALRSTKYDFIVSDLHWGTRWTYYRKYGLNVYPKVLIDGDDALVGDTWRDKYERYCRRYVWDPPESVKAQEVCPYPWMEPLDGYAPDIVFTSQKQQGDQKSFYLPFGIHDEAKQFYEGKATFERNIDFAHIPGGGKRRLKMSRCLRLLRQFKLIPGVVNNSPVRGDEVIPEQIRDKYAQDKSHGYFRWVLSRKYFCLLNRTKVLIYPGVENRAWWDSKRPWEAYASGCLVLMARPANDSDYPVTEICSQAVFDSIPEAVYKMWFLYRHPSILDKMRIAAVERAWTYFSSVPIARYFLARIHHALGRI